MPGIDDIGPKQLLLPLAASAVTVGGTLAACKLANGTVPAVKDKLEQQADGLKKTVEEAGGPRGMATKAAEKMRDGRTRGQGWGHGRRLPIQASIDVPVPVSYAYDHWTDFQRLGNFLHRVERVEEKNERIVWHENIWGRRRTWHAKILEQRRNQLIAWRDEHGIGALTFHELAPRLTRIELNYDWAPHGVVEKLASGVRVHKRAATSDLRRFKAFAITQYAKENGNGNRTATPGRRRKAQRA